jgi:UDP-glucose 4-epimerase
VKIVILGATGFLGRLVTTRLAREGHHIVCVARKPGIQISADNIEYVQATLDDARAISENAKGADFLLHFAWDTTPGTSKGQPTIEAVNNLLPTFRMIEELQSLEGCQLIFVSSAGAVYDETACRNVPAGLQCPDIAPCCNCQTSQRLWPGPTGETAICDSSDLDARNP